MKNILLTIITFLVVVIAILTMVKGIKIGNFQILSIGQIVQKSNELTTKIDELNKLNNETYKKTLEEVSSKTKLLLTAKSKYLEVASTSTSDEIKNANQNESYAAEFLWSKIGNHATGNGVTLKMEVKPTGATNLNTLSFVVNGDYMDIRDFVYALENDSDLNFTIDGFKLTGSGNALTATFTVADVAIKPETITSKVERTEETDNTENNTKTTDEKKTNTTEENKNNTTNENNTNTNSNTNTNTNTNSNTNTNTNSNTNTNTNSNTNTNTNKQ